MKFLCATSSDIPSSSSFLSLTAAHIRRSYVCTVCAPRVARLRLHRMLVCPEGSEREGTHCAGLNILSRESIV